MNLFASMNFHTPILELIPCLALDYSTFRFSFEID